MSAASCLILTTAHDPADARLNRHLAALEEAGITASLIAEPPAGPVRRTLLATGPVWRHLRSIRPDAVLLPDPELYVAGTIVARVLGVRAVIDIHEDYAAVARDREWIPSPFRSMVSALARLVMAVGRRLADATVVAADHLQRPGDQVVANLPSAQWFAAVTPSAARPAVVYVGDVTVNRGAFEMVDLLELVPGLHLELIGPVTDRLRVDLLARASKAATTDRLHLAGRLPYEAAWQQARGAIAGLSLLRNTAAYRSALPTKVWEYMAAGLPVLGSPLPSQAELLRTTGGGIVVPSIESAAEVLTTWLADPEPGMAIGRRGRLAYENEIDHDTSVTALLEAIRG